MHVHVHVLFVVARSFFDVQIVLETLQKVRKTTHLVPERWEIEEKMQRKRVKGGKKRNRVK